jgi:hypothetical protein
MNVNASLIHQRQFPNFPKNFAAPVFDVPPQETPVLSWELVPQWALVPQFEQPPVQFIPQQEGMSFGTFLAGLATVAGGIVLFDPKASKEAKAIAQMALGASVPFLLNKAFDLQAWPGQQFN